MPKNQANVSRNTSKDITNMAQGQIKLITFDFSITIADDTVKVGTHKFSKKKKKNP
jgi:hypothetical protein